MRMRAANEYDIARDDAALVLQTHNGWLRDPHVISAVCAAHSIKCFRAMLDAHADFWCMLVDACKYDFIEAEHLVIGAGFNDFDTCMSGTCLRGSVTTARVLLDAGADVPHRAFIYACIGGHTELVRLLVSRRQCNVGEGLKRVANVETAQVLLDAGANNIAEAVDSAQRLGNDEVEHMLRSLL